MEKLIFNLCLPNEAFVDNWHQVDTKTIQMTSLYRTMLVKPWKKEKNENVKQLNTVKNPVCFSDIIWISGCILCEWSSIEPVWGMNYSDDTFSRHYLSVVQHTTLDLKQHTGTTGPLSSDTRGHTIDFICKLKSAICCTIVNKSVFKVQLFKPKLTITEHNISQVPGGGRTKYTLANNVSWVSLSWSGLQEV